MAFNAWLSWLWMLVLGALATARCLVTTSKSHAHSERKEAERPPQPPPPPQQQHNRDQADSNSLPDHSSFASGWGSDHDTLNLAWSSSSLSNSMEGMHARAVKDCKLIYMPQAHRLHVSVKIHHPALDIQPERLHKTAVPELCTRVQSSVSGAVVLNAAVRQGCVSVSFDISHQAPATLPAANSGSSMRAALAGLVRQTAMDWARQVGTAEQLAHGTCVTVQIGTTSTKCVWDAHGQVWSTEVSEEHDNLEDCRLVVSSPVLLLSPPPPNVHMLDGLALPAEQAPQDPVALQVPQLLAGHAWEEQEGPATYVVFRATVCTPVPGRVLGWLGTETMQAGASNAPFQLLARVRGRFLMVQVEQADTEEAQEGGHLHQSTLQVRVCVPPEVAYSCVCTRLQLELLYRGKLACGQGMLLVPGHLAALAQEVHSLSESEDASQAHAFNDDLMDWLQLQGIAAAVTTYAEGSPALRRLGRRPREDSAMEENGPDRLNLHRALAPMLSALSQQGGWGGAEAAVVGEATGPEAVCSLIHTGKELLQCAIAWGLPAIAEQLLQGLMHAPCNLPFRTLAAGTESEPEAQPHTEDPASSTASVGGSTNLLALALMSSSPIMLARVLHWGRVHGGVAFTWCRGAEAAAEAAAREEQAVGSLERTVGMRGAREEGPAGEGWMLVNTTEEEAAAVTAATAAEAVGSMDEGVLSMVLALPADDPCLQLLLADPVEGPLAAAVRMLGTGAAAAAAAGSSRGPAFNATPTHVTMRGSLGGGRRVAALCSMVLWGLTGLGLSDVHAEGGVRRSQAGGSACNAVQTVLRWGEAVRTAVCAAAARVAAGGGDGGSRSSAGRARTVQPGREGWGEQLWAGGQEGGGEQLWAGGRDREVRELQRKVALLEMRLSEAGMAAVDSGDSRGAAGAYSASSLPAWPSQRPRRATKHFMVAGIKGTFLGFGEPGGGCRGGSAYVSESDFRAWCRASNKRWAAGCCWTIISCVVVAVLKSITHNSLSSELPVLLLYGTPYLFVLSANKHAPHKRQAWMRATKLCRLLSMVLMGMRVIPVPIAIAKLVEKHLEFITDLLIHRVADQVQLRALLLDRLTSTSAFFALYSALDLDRPLLRSLGLNLCSLCVGLGLDARNRAIYLRLRAQQGLRAKGE